MIICRTPFRISFFGGGTDYPVWYRDNRGAVISTTINKYSFITARWLPPVFDYRYRIRYYEKEEVNAVGEIKHPSVRECLNHLKIEKGVDIVHNADLPAQAGLGSSSSFTVGLLHALNALKNNMVTKRGLALEAIKVEQELIAEAVGSQDQVAAAFGGLNLITFDKSRTFEVNPTLISPDRLNNLQESLVLVFTGFARTASTIAKLQIQSTPSKTTELKAMSALCESALKYLINEHHSLNEFGNLLNEQWRLKRSISPLITNPDIDDLYDTAMKSGAIGGKLLGAGGGGFMLFFVPKSNRLSVISALKGKLIVPFRFESSGSQVVYYSHD